MSSAASNDSIRRGLAAGSTPVWMTPKALAPSRLASTVRDAAKHMPLDELVDEALHRTDYRRAVTASADGDAFDRLDNLAMLAYDASVLARDHGGDGDTPEEPT